MIAHGLNVRLASTSAPPARGPDTGPLNVLPGSHAEGALDAYVEEGVNPWDHAAGALVVDAALSSAARKIVEASDSHELPAPRKDLVH